MALRWAGSLWQQVAGSGVIRRPVTAVPSVRSAKESETRHNPITFHLRGSIWRQCGSLWRSLVPFIRLNAFFSISSFENHLIHTQSGEFKPLNLTAGIPHSNGKTVQHKPFRQRVKCKTIHCCHSLPIRLTACHTDISFAVDNRSNVRTSANIVKH